MSNKTILLLNGPNLNRLGSREPEIYGAVTLNHIVEKTQEYAMGLNFRLVHKQSNHEGQLIDWIQEAETSYSVIIFNPGGYSHTSIALLDAVKACSLPLIELHISNIFAREQFRHHSFISQVASGIICGFGLKGYYIAIDAAVKIIETIDFNSHIAEA